MAKFYPGTITFNDGTKKTGLIEIPYFDTPKLKFKAEKKSDTEKFGIELVKEFNITNEDNQEYTYLALKLYYINGWRVYELDSEKKRWARIEKKGKINLMTIYSSDGYHYCLNKSWDENCYHIMSYYGGLSVSINEFKKVKHNTDLIFKEDCPELAESLTKEDYKEKGLKVIIDNYMMLCGSTK